MLLKLKQSFCGSDSLVLLKKKKANRVLRCKLHGLMFVQSSWGITVLGRLERGLKDIIAYIFKKTSYVGKWQHFEGPWLAEFYASLWRKCSAQDRNRATLDFFCKIYWLAPISILFYYLLFTRLEEHYYSQSKELLCVRKLQLPKHVSLSPLQFITIPFSCLLAPKGNLIEQAHIVDWEKSIFCT